MISTPEAALLVEDLLCGFLKILRLRVGNVGEGLRIAIGEREPRALNLVHDAMAAGSTFSPLFK